MCVWRGLERVSLHKCSCTCREELGITSVWTVGADSHGHGHASHAGRGPSRSDFAFGLVPAVPLLFSGVNLCFPFTWVSWLWPSSLGACPSAVARGLVPGGRPLLRVLVEPRVAPTRPRCPASRSSHWTTRGFRAFTGSPYFMDLEWFKNVVMLLSGACGCSKTGCPPRGVASPSGHRRAAWAAVAGLPASELPGLRGHGLALLPPGALGTSWRSRVLAAVMGLTAAQFACTLHSAR